MESDPCPAASAFEAHAEGRSDPALERHVESCPDCARRYEQAQRERGLMRSLRRAVHRGKASTPELTVPGFELVSALGQGGQGRVFEALQVSTGRRVALKVLAQGERATKAQRARFLREIRLTAKLAHPGLVTVFEAGETTSGLPYLAMERIHGKPWDEWSDERRAGDPEDALLEVLSAFVSLSAAVGHAHARGILHRDLKPSNVLVDASGRPRVLDLGLARSSESRESEFRTRPGEFLGSFAWTSPEQLAGKETQPATDVFALGLLLHRGLTGRRALGGDSIAEIVAAVAQLPGSIQTPLCADARIAEAAHRILSRALNGEPERRHRDAGELSEAVADALRSI